MMKRQIEFSPHGLAVHQYRAAKYSARVGDGYALSGYVRKAEKSIDEAEVRVQTTIVRSLIHAEES